MAVEAIGVTTPPKPVVPDHELIRPIGKGAYGEVWLARNIMGTWRAVKVVYRSRFDDPRPFEREFAGIQRFEPVSRSHPSQVHILHMGRNQAEGYFYYVMELADDQARGQQIDPDTYAPRTIRSELMLHHRLPAAECMRLAFELTTALEHLHQGSLVHRDIKPSNIIFVDGRPKLADIGLVSDIDATRSYVGTEGYVPPEGPGTVQADVYGLGKVLYELVTGLDRQQFPELPSGQGIDAAEEAALSELNEVITRACDPDVKRRYPTAGAMRADLELLQAGQSLARLRGVEKRLRFVQRAGAVVTAVAAVIAAGWYWQARQTETVRQLVDEKTRLAQENQQRAMEQTRLATEVSAIAEENRERLVRLHVANGLRLLDNDDPGGALIWYAEALPLLKGRPAEEDVHRIRIKATMRELPRLLRVIAHEPGSSMLWGAFSPDGRTIATGSINEGKGELRVWDADTGELRYPPVWFEKHVGSLQFSADGRRLVVRSSRDSAHTLSIGVPGGPGFAGVLDAGTGLTLYPLLTNVIKTAVSPDARWLAASFADHTMQLIEVETGRSLSSLNGHTNTVRSIAFSGDGNWLATGGEDKTARVWRVPSGDPEGSALVHDDSVYRVALSPSGRTLATASVRRGAEESQRVFIWDVRRGVRLGGAIRVAGEIQALFFSPDHGRQLFVGDGYAIRVWDPDLQVEVRPPFELKQRVRCWAFSPCGGLLVVGTEQGTATIWGANDSEKGVEAPLRHTGWVESISFSPDETRLLVTSDDGTAKLWDRAVFHEAVPEVQLRDCRGVSKPSPDGRSMLAGWPDDTLSLVDLETLQERTPRIPIPNTDFDPSVDATAFGEFDSTGRQWAVATCQSRSFGLWRQAENGLLHFELLHPAVVIGGGFVRSADRFMTITTDGVVRVWNTQDGSMAREISIPVPEHFQAAFSADGRILSLAVHTPPGGGFRESRLFDVETGAAIGEPIRDGDWMNVTSFSPDGTRLATASNNQTGRIWDTMTAQPITPPFKHGAVLRGIVWSPDGQTVLTIGLSTEVRLWDAATGEPMLSPMAMPEQVKVANFSPDGRFIVVTDWGNHVRVWHAATAEAVTPLLKWDDDPIVSVSITSRDRLVVGTFRGFMRVFDLHPEAMPEPAVIDRARLLAGRQLNDSGVMLPIPAARLAASFHEFNQTYPELADRPREHLKHFHRRNISTDDLSPWGVSRSTFHLEQLSLLAPDEEEPARQLEQQRKAKIPPRLASTPPSLLDLSDAYTIAMDAVPTRDFAELPRGVQRLADTEFDIRGIVALVRGATDPGSPGFDAHSRGRIRVYQRCDKIHLLHGLLHEAPEGIEVARWTIHYEDGSRRSWPIRYGAEVRDIRWHADKPRDATHAMIAWEGKNLESTQVRLFKATWENPAPDLEITHLELEIGDVPNWPLVVAITAE